MGNLLGMLFNAQKSAHLLVRGGTTSIHDEEIPHVEISGVALPRVTNHHHLGIMVKEKLTWTDHTNVTYTACAQKVGMLSRLRKVLNPDCICRMYMGAVQPRLEYACSLWCGGNYSKLKKLQESFCRRHQVFLEPLEKRLDYHTLLLFFKIKSKVPHGLTTRQ